MSDVFTFRGVYTALITPFQNEGRDIDYGAYRKLIERQIAAGVAGLVPCGTTGESPTLSHEEHHLLIKRTVEYAKGRTRIIAGTGSNSTQEAIELSEAAEAAGVDAVMLVNPYYNKPSQEGLYQHFRSVADAVRCPVLLYNIKGRTAVNLETPTLLRLLEHPRIFAVKEASGDPGQMARIKAEAGGRIQMLSGDDNITPAVMALGGSGLVSVASNIYPSSLVKMMDFYLEGDFSKGNEIFYKLFPFMQALFWQTNPVPVKEAAAIKELSSPFVRLPLVRMSEEERSRLAEVMREVEAEL